MTQYPTVECFGISLNERHFNTRADWLGGCCLDWFPNVKRIRFVDVLDKGSIDTGVELREYVVDKPPGIIFEDALGNVID